MTLVESGKSKSTFTDSSGSGGTEGSSRPCASPPGWQPAERPPVRLPWPARRSRIRRSVSAAMRTRASARAVRRETGLSPTSTIRLAPWSSKWVNGFMVFSSHGQRRAIVGGRRAARRGRPKNRNRRRRATAEIRVSQVRPATELAAGGPPQDCCLQGSRAANASPRATARHPVIWWRREL
jgi:hypothetical protein